MLRVATDSGTRRVLFAEGEVRGAVSERVGERLSEILVRMGSVKRDEMEALCEEAGDPRAGRAGSRSARGLCSERDLWNAVQEHVTTIFQAILLESQGSFVLTEEAQSDDASVPGLSAEAPADGGRAAARRAARRPRARRRRAARACWPPSTAPSATSSRPPSRRAPATRCAGAAESVFEDERAHAGVFRDLRFGPDGELDESDVLERARARRAERGARRPRP